MLNTESWLKLINLLSDVVVFDSYNFEQFLKKLIQLLTSIIPVESCLIYFYDKERKDLILVASKKTHSDLIGRITMKRGEGITGWVATHKLPVILNAKAYADDRFKSFKELPEDKYEAFMSVPILNKEGVIGVINFQNSKPYLFSKEQVETIEAVVKIIASAFKAVILQRRIGDLKHELEDRKIIEKAKGILMNERSITENEAFTLIRKEAMKKRKTMREIADAILLIY